MTGDDEVKAAFADALAGLTLAERRAVWAAAVYGTRLPDVVRLTPFVQRIVDLRRRFG